MLHHDGDDDDNFWGGDDDHHWWHHHDRVGFRKVNCGSFERASGERVDCDADDNDDGDRDQGADAHGSCETRHHKERYLAPVEHRHDSVCMSKTACDMYINGYLLLTGGKLEGEPNSCSGDHDKDRKYVRFHKAKYCNVAPDTEGDRDHDGDHDDHDRDDHHHGRVYHFSDDRVQHEIARLLEWWKTHDKDRH